VLVEDVMETFMNECEEQWQALQQFQREQIHAEVNEACKLLILEHLNRHKAQNR
jgi:hypothetical protein